MLFRNGLFTSESVSAGHPDKLCDQISDAILDAFLNGDPDARVACETLAADSTIIVTGEFRTAGEELFREIEAAAPDIVRTVLRDAGYGSSELDIDPDTCRIAVHFNHQSPQIARGVDRADQQLGAGDQGMMFGYATNETDALMPLPVSLAHDLLARGGDLRRRGNSGLRPDAKSQVTVRYRDGKPAGVQSVVLSWQHEPDVTLPQVQDLLLEQVIDEVIPRDMRTADFRLWLNPAGTWSIGGPKGDTGLTGRKIIVDTYGGACPHGGGAFSGKDPSKVDRSAAYAARYIARHVVAAGLAERCTVQLAYAIGHPEPVSVSVDLHGTGRVAESALEAAIPRVFDLSPRGIIEELRLNRPNYRKTATLGHFGRHTDPAEHPWETNPHTDALIAAAGGQLHG
ncbi:S-adenosylmethionine synthetase [Natronocella acetinitrilica]|uniref:S-adenosylmethionine synthase n=1 Tax=Natronocella acetinitrilica TaxID=414046 RepID=A0AAE3G9J8_9GAMM|nr:methionine adenosyltransferase [Natronocella acetinitrilica]MCP1677008.1 S-adenosylmethionine synthetase [Natronocella acetinitrilica]